MKRSKEHHCGKRKENKTKKKKKMIAKNDWYSVKAVKELF